MEKMKLKISLLVSILVIISGVINCAQAQWGQIGVDIEGENAGDRFGHSISLNSDGTIVAIGAPYNSEIGNDAGHVRVFEIDNGSWKQIGNDIDGESQNNYAGYTVCLNSTGTILAYGAPKNDGNSYNSGHVRVYEYISGNWMQMGADIDSEEGGDEFGHSISLSDNGLFLAVGAWMNDGNGSGSGQIRVFEYVSGNWLQKGSDIDGEYASDLFGESISLSADGNIVAAGSVYNDDGGSNAGHVRVFEYISGDWSQIGSDIDGEATGDESGSAISISANGQIIAIGAEENDGNGSNSGHVRVYKYSSGNWGQKGTDIDALNTGERIGMDVSINSNGNIVSIGGDTFVRIYEFINGDWVQQRYDILGEVITDYFGHSISLNDDGSVVAIGGERNDGNGDESGHVRVYENICFPYHVTLDTIDVYECHAYTSPSGNYYWTSSGFYSDTIQNTHGCDSVIFINLSINPQLVYVADFGNYLMTYIADTNGAKYQWLDCNNSYAVINGATNQSFTPTSLGSYAVEVTQNGCSDTSDCHNVTSVSIEQFYFDSRIVVYPNPTNGIITIMGDGIENIEIINLEGQLIEKIENCKKVNDIDLSTRSKGIHLMKIIKEKGIFIEKIMLE
jgi:hypothetical protein